MVAGAVLASVGGGGALVVALSAFLGKLWASRLMEQERSQHESALESLRADLAARNAAEVERLKTSFDLAKSKLLGAHDQKVALYQEVAKIVAHMVVEIQAGMEKIRQLPLNDAIAIRLQFERDRLRAYAYLAMFAPQSVMDAYDSVVDYLLEVLDATRPFKFEELRAVGIGMLNAIRNDLGIDPQPIAYRGKR